MDHDVAGPQQSPPGLVESEPVACHVPGDRVKTAGDLPVEAVAELSTEAVEAVVAEDLAPDALGGPMALAGSHQDNYLALGHASEQPLD